MKNQARRDGGAGKTGFLWEMQMVHINRPVHSKTGAKLKPRSTGTRHYVPWLSLVAVKI